LNGLLDWYLLGSALGLGVAAGAGATGRGGGRALAVLAYAGALLIAVLAGGWVWLGPAVGLAVVLVFFRRLAREAALAAVIALAALALVPAAGYLEAAAAPLLGRRLGRRAGSRYAGLRVLAKD
jgi:hypothetical protein